MPAVAPHTDHSMGTEAAAHLLQCSEVWGGNEPVDRGVVMQGLDAWVLAQPHNTTEAGGDIHYLSSCSSGRITRMLVADVSGHGIAVAPVARTLRGLVRRFMNFVDQSRLVGSINQEFSQLTRDGGFATAIIGTYWGPTGRLELTSAGHPPPLMYSVARKSWLPVAPSRAGGEPASSGASDVPLGIFEDSSFTVFHVDLAQGDMVLLYTDAIIEARRTDGSLLQISGLARMLNALSETAPEAISRAVMQQLSAEGYFIDDDATMMLVKPNTVTPHGSLLGGWKSVLRLVRDVAVPGRDGPIELPGFRADLVLGWWFDRFNRRGH